MRESFLMSWSRRTWTDGLAAAGVGLGAERASVTVAADLDLAGVSGAFVLEAESAFRAALNSAMRALACCTSDALFQSQYDLFL